MKNAKKRALSEFKIKPLHVGIDICCERFLFLIFLRFKFAFNLKTKTSNVQNIEQPSDSIVQLTLILLRTLGLILLTSSYRQDFFNYLLCILTLFYRAS